jgi:signal peptidase I
MGLVGEFTVFPWIEPFHKAKTWHYSTFFGGFSSILRHVFGIFRPYVAKEMSPEGVYQGFCPDLKPKNPSFSNNGKKAIMMVMKKANNASRTRQERKNQGASQEGPGPTGGNGVEAAPLLKVLSMPKSGESKSPLKKDNDPKPSNKEALDKDEESKEEESMTWQAHLMEYGKAILIAVILALFIRSFFIQAFHIPSGSMIPTILEGDRVLVLKFAYGVRNPFTNRVWFNTGVPQRGDVVIFKFPSDPKVDFVKRVVGLPGEEVELRNGQIYINQELISDPHGSYTGSPYTPSRNFGPVKVPENQYFVMGDNRDFSNDSRGWGFVDSTMMRGKAWILYWSWDSKDNLPFWKRLRLSRLGHKIV